ncbi:MAG TPA: hypothetical protein DCP37_07015 [Dehalococcoidia bacterium]|nr:hypothetical protein [Dehalococcoidia bacterium]
MSGPVGGPPTDNLRRTLALEKHPSYVGLINESETFATRLDASGRERQIERWSRRTSTRRFREMGR